MVGGVEPEWLGVIKDVGGEEGGDGGEYLVEEPGTAGVASPAGGAGSAGYWLAWVHSLQSQGRSKG